MAQLIITDMWNKVNPDRDFGKSKVIRDQYEVKSISKSSTSYQSFEEMHRTIRERFPEKYQGLENGQVKVDGNRAYGVHSYQLIDWQAA